MNGCATCVTCGVLTSDFETVSSKHYCDGHAAAARKQRGILANSRAMMGNRNASKRSGNPARRAGEADRG